MMRAFAELLDKLLLTPARNRKVELLVNYFKAQPDPDRGIALAAITGDLNLKAIKPTLLRSIITSQTDEMLFRLSYDYVGDLTETISLLWPEHEASGTSTVSLSQAVQILEGVSRSDAAATMRNLLNRLRPAERYALIKLATGAMRIGVSARLAKQALATFGNKEMPEIEELWHGLDSPYVELFAWLESKGPKPVSVALAPFRPVMLSHALEQRDQEKITPDDFIAEWKWDGIRVQTSCEAGVRRIYSRTGDDISPAFPDMAAAMTVEGTFDGELLVRSQLDQPLAIGSFSDLQQRLNRKTVTKPMLKSSPGFIRLYDVLILEGQDLRALPLHARRGKLEKAVIRMDADRFDLSPVLPFADFDELSALRANPPYPVIEGLMLKQRDSAYMAGRPRGPWFKWKRDPMLVDAVLMYAQRGHGKRSGYYSDFTFGCWRDGPNGDELVPVGKAYFGFTDDELKKLDKFVRNNTLERFGPVRTVKAQADHGLVLEIAFEGINRSTRHKSGVAMRFPRISHIRWDKPPAEADRVEFLAGLIG